MQKLDEAPGAIAALLHLSAIAVKNAIAKVDVRLRRLLDQQDLISADAEAAIGKQPQLFRRQLDALRNSIQHHEVVACAVHLRKPKLHPLARARDARP